MERTLKIFQKYIQSGKSFSVKLLGDFVAGITCEEYDGGEGEQGKEDFLHNVH